jgi:tetratricopeptide (TPR) repeat protein
MQDAQHFTREHVQRILDVSDKQLHYWERLRLVSPKKDSSGAWYDFRDLIGLRAAKQLIEKGVKASQLRRALRVLEEQLRDVQAPLTELTIAAHGKEIVVERQGRRLEPISGQFLLNFETRELAGKVRALEPRGVDDWFAEGLRQEAEGRPRAAIEAYRQALALGERMDVLMNLGALLYEADDFEQAAHCFERAVALAPASAAARFNLGNALDDLGRFPDAHLHLSAALRLDPRFADAYYNLAIVCEKMNLRREARTHWKQFLELCPRGPAAEYARRRLSFPL